MTATDLSIYRLFIQKHIVPWVVSLPSSQEEYICFLNMLWEKKFFLKTTINCKSGLCFTSETEEGKKESSGLFFFLFFLLNSGLPRA